MLKFIKLIFRTLSKTTAEKYLANSTSMEDLEQRQKLISKGEAPFQKYNKIYIYGASF